MRILGIDPGSRITGYGVIDQDAHGHHYVASGCIRTPEGELSQKLHIIFTNLKEIIAIHQPDYMAIEQVFLARNADSALKLGQARGAAILAGTVSGLSVMEYSARRVKQSIVGTGAAEKAQVQLMIMYLLKLIEKPQADAADALAIALCHAHHHQSLKVQGLVGARQRRGRLRITALPK